MNISSELIAILLRSTALTTVGYLLWWLVKGKSAAAAVFTGRLLITGALLLMLGPVVSGITNNKARRTKHQEQPEAEAETLTLPLPSIWPEQPSGLSTHESNTAPQEQPLRPKLGAEAQLWQLSPQSMSIITGLWALGVASVGLHWLWALHLRRKLTVAAQPVTDDAWTAQTAGVRLLQHPKAAMPCAYGVLSPVILLPHPTTNWTHAQRRMVLAHETAHLRHRDPLWQSIWRLFLATQWFHPLAWLLHRQYTVATEQAADDAVLQQEPDALTYADLLVSCSRAWAGAGNLATVCSSMAGKHGVCTRVEQVLNPLADRSYLGKTRRLAMSLGCLAIAGGFWALIAGPAVAGTGAETSTLNTLNQSDKSPESNTVRDNGTAIPAGTYSLSPLRSSGNQSGNYIVTAARPFHGNSYVEASSVKFATGDFYGLAIPWQLAHHNKNSTLPQLLSNNLVKISLDRVEPSSVSQIPPTPPSKAGEATKAWHPQTFDGLEYVSLEEINNFYSCELKEDTTSPGMKPKNHLILSPEQRLLSLKNQNIKKDGALWISQEDVNRLLDPVLRSTKLEPKPFDTVILDAGHGGKDTGTSGKLGRESTYNLDTTLRLGKLLEAKGIKVIYTRKEDTFVELEARAKLITEYPKAILVSVHFNTGPAILQGIETYFQGGWKPGVALEESNACRAQSAGLALAMHGRCRKTLGITDRGVRAGKFTILLLSTIPAVLVEAGFLSNPEERKKIATPEYRQQLAEALCDGISAYRK
jgi:N-acetylmuramoyl-L-alanine amidase